MMRSSELLSEHAANFILSEASRCVSCGLCLPHCPTYKLLKSEADSPRGRIALMNGVASKHIPMNERFVQHMDRCLTCRACESVCPNNVAYGQLIDEVRVMIAVSASGLKKSRVINKKTKLRALLEKEFIAKPKRFDRLRSLFNFFQKSGLQLWLRNSSLLGKIKLGRLVAHLPPVNFTDSSSVNGKKVTKNIWQEIYPEHGRMRGDVGLFLGCVARLADVETLNSAIFVLNRLGYRVHVPSDQTCCGALHQHSGDIQMAAQLAQQNKMVFDGLNSVHSIVSTASGCGVQLADYYREQAKKSGVPLAVLEENHCNDEAKCGEDKKVLSGITDISKFLATAKGWEDVEIAPLSYKVAVHDPCSLRNVLHDQAYAYTLISRIPDVQVVPLAGNGQCCGAAGTYFLDQPELAKMLLDEKVSAVTDSDIRYLVTSNIGCSLHIVSGLRETGSDLEVLHPVTLLARQMGIQL